MPEEDPSLDGAGIRRLLADKLERSLAPDQVVDVIIEGNWVCVILSATALTPGLAQRAYGALAKALPQTRVEVRRDNLIYRGGSGFGEGRYVVAVLGGKGGVGKSTVAVNLALTLTAMGLKVGLLDADIHAPDVPHLLGISMTEASPSASWRLSSGQIPSPSKWMEPFRRYQVEVMSVGLVVPERFAPRITSRLQVSTLLRNLVFQVAWEADVLIVDAPPGTGEELQVIARELPLSGALFVTTPQDLAQMDAERTISLINEHAVPIVGLVKNMASMTCPHCDQQIDMFAPSARLSGAGLSVLGEIPFDLRLSSATYEHPLVLADPRGPVAYQFAKIGHATRQWLTTNAAAGRVRPTDALS